MDLFRRFWAWWKVVGQAIGDFIARILLTIFYFTIFMPFGLIVRLVSDPLDIKHSQARWLDRKTNDLVMDDSRRLF
jgi:hypothetical protein